LEIWGPDGRSIVRLDGERVSVGKRAGNDVVLDWDSEASRVHAVFERLGDAWCLRDLASTNGTFLNGERIFTERPLRHADEIHIGRTRLIFRERDKAAQTATDSSVAPPELTVRERDVLAALCAPLLQMDIFTEPASTRDMARMLVVTEAAIKQHLTNLYDKFGLHDPSERRRVRLANEAIHRGAIAASDLRGR
jgi:pSer/pThr/pTyr-binding forkhead associated (FHA) protein